MILSTTIEKSAIQAADLPQHRNERAPVVQGNGERAQRIQRRKGNLCHSCQDGGLMTLSDNQQKVIDLLNDGYTIVGASIGYGGKSTGARAYKSVPGKMGLTERVNEGAIKALMRKQMVQKVDRPGNTPQYKLA